jgi:hypothetical protein
MGSIVVEHIDNIFVGSHTTVETTPGMHTVTFRTQALYEFGRYSITFDAEAGHSYEFVVKPIEGNRFRADIIDVTERVK